MVEEGYAAVSTRRVAARARLKAPLVHYYFPTMDDLLVAVYRRAAERGLERLTCVLASGQPLRALWEYNCDLGDADTALALELMALANHRKVVGKEIARYGGVIRQVQTMALSSLIKDGLIDPNIYPPAGLTVLMAGISRALVMEEALGISLGHAEAKAIMESLLRRFEAVPPDPKPGVANGQKAAEEPSVFAGGSD
jgi:AcrR family transcriptional regulator